MESYRRPSRQAERQVLARAIGADGYWLLAVVWAPATPPWRRSVAAVAVPRQIWVQQFVSDDGQVGWRDGANLPPASQRITSARWWGRPFPPGVAFSMGNYFSNTPTGSMVRGTPGA
jgi:hypothetical protein